MRRTVEDDAEERARKQFRLFVLLYLAYPAIILSLLGVIGVGAYLSLRDGSILIAEPAITPEPAWCYPGSFAGYGQSAPSSVDGIEPAIPPGAPFVPSLTAPIPSIAEGVDEGGISARERISYYVSVSIRAADGAQDAYYQRKTISLSQVELEVARRQFVERSRRDGRLGFIRLGIAQLGGEAFDIAGRNKLSVPYCRGDDFTTLDKRQAYVNFAIASFCDTSHTTRANDWLIALAEHERYSGDQIVSMRSEASSYLASEPRACVTQLADESGVTSDADLESGDEREDAEYYGRRSARGAQDETSEERRARRARRYLAEGDAALNQRDLEKARERWQRAIDVGRRHGAQASIIAQKRLQTYTLTCHPNDETVKSISRDYKELDGDLIHTRAIQRALRALGHYDGPVNGMLGPMTRAAIRKFQREMAFDETDTLTPLQTVYVICNAAQIARDPASQNVLGIMYATGLGVKINIDLALEWLRTASSRRHAESTYHLALIFGTGIILNSYRLCDIAQNLDQADEYLREAANQGYPPAVRAWHRHGHKPQAKRWEDIKKELLENATFANAEDHLKHVGKSCQKPDDEETATPPDEQQQQQQQGGAKPL
jgi:TPR repeat protein